MKRRGSQPTLNDVAVRANLSKQTVSRVINNKGEVADDTRARVLEVIREIGYYPNTLARSLVTSKTNVIGLSLPNIDQPFFPQIARGVEDTAYENDFSVFLCNASGDPERELRAIERLRGHRVDGVISFNSRLTDETIERAIGNMFPIVMINRELPGVRGTVIWPGYEEGARLAVEHLLVIGRRRVTYLGLDAGSNVDADKYRGYERALEQAGIAVDPDRVTRVSKVVGRGFNELASAGEETIVRLMEAGVRFDGIFASNDLPGIGAMRHLIDAGVAVPDDVAIVGFGGANVTGFVTPGLTTVEMPLYEMGRSAFHVLFDRINGAEQDARLVDVTPSLIVRGSSVATTGARWDAEVAVSNV
ncbi:MAG TPA: LacI family DNA-binding transcriptional regulator [Thermomicrobiales bacterium]|nr:LacI family DNA-binding transcriptional regulator [Thermomicrobiales bacterium]